MWRNEQFYAFWRLKNRQNGKGFTSIASILWTSPVQMKSFEISLTTWFWTLIIFWANAFLQSGSLKIHKHKHKHDLSLKNEKNVINLSTEWENEEEEESYARDCLY